MLKNENLMEKPHLRLFKFTLHTKYAQDALACQHFHHPKLTPFLQRQLGQMNQLEIPLELSIHPSSKRILRELEQIFPEYFTQPKQFQTDQDSNQIYIIPTIQRTEHDLSGRTYETEIEKNDCLEKFTIFALLFSLLIRQRGYWADLTDPASGYPLLGPSGASFYPDVQGTQKLLKYEMHLIGCCSVLVHPNWGTRIYPATLFTNAPLNVISEVLDNEMKSVHEQREELYQ